MNIPTASWRSFTARAVSREGGRPSWWMGRALSALYDSLDFVRPEQIVEALDEIDLDGVIGDSDVVGVVDPLSGSTQMRVDGNPGQYKKPTLQRAEVRMQ